jgi:glycosyltransferase involved in cell wall biosynthesis
VKALPRGRGSVLVRWKLRIGFFQSGFPVPDGTTTAVRGLGFALAKAGHQITIYGCGRGEKTADGFDNSNPRVLLFERDSKNPFRVSKSLIRKFERNEEKLDLLVINLMFNPPNVAVARAARRGRIPYIMSPHDPYHPELLAKNRLRKLVYGALFERSLVRKAAAVQVLAESHAAHLRKFGFAGKVLVIPNGFDNSSLSFSSGEAHGTNRLSGFPRFLSLGRLDMHHKGLDLLIEAFARGLRSGVLPPSASLTFVGPDGGDLQTLRNLASNERVDANVSFAGRVPDEVRWEMLRSCDFVVLCSRYDGFGLVALEGMLAGRPLIISRDAGISGCVEKADCGILVEPSPDEICSGFAKAMQLHPHWAAMGQRGQAYAHENMTWEQMARRAEECYRTLLAAQQTPQFDKTCQSNIIGAV